MNYEFDYEVIADRVDVENDLNEIYLIDVNDEWYLFLTDLFVDIKHSNLFHIDLKHSKFDYNLYPHSSFKKINRKN
jgi:hypothetical protein